MFYIMIYEMQECIIHISWDFKKEETNLSSLLFPLATENESNDHEQYWRQPKEENLKHLLKSRKNLAEK